MRRLTRQQILLLHDQMLTATGGLAGVRDENLLDSAQTAPFGALGEVEFYPSVHAKAARLALGLIKNHPINDGNKRLGMQAMLVFLHIHGIRLTFTDAELVGLGLGVADGTIDGEGIQTWILDHQVEEQ